MESDTSPRERLTRFYNFYNPKQLGDIDNILEAYHNDHDALFQDLVYKYGPEPDLHGNLPKGTALQHQESPAGSSRPPSYEEYRSEKYAAASYTYYEIPPEEAPSRGLKSAGVNNNDNERRNRRIAQVSSSYYGRGYVQEAQDSARDMLYEAALIAELQHKREGPSSADDVEWWKEQDRLTRDGAVQISATGDKSVRGISPGRGSHTSPKHFNSFAGTNKPEVGYSSHWGKAGFQSPTPKKPPNGRPESESVTKDPPIPLTAQLQAAGQDPPFDVICVKCGCLAKMNADGSILPGSHPEHSPLKTPERHTQTQHATTKPHRDELQASPEAHRLAPPNKPTVTDPPAARPLPPTVGGPEVADETATSRPLPATQKRPQDSSFFGQYEESVSVPDDQKTAAFGTTATTQGPETPLGQDIRQESVSTFHDSPHSPNRKLSSVDTRTNRPLPPGESPKVTPPRARPQPTAVANGEGKKIVSPRVQGTNGQRPGDSHEPNREEDVVHEGKTSLNTSQQSNGSSDGENNFGKTFGQMEETQDLSHAYPELDPGRARKPEQDEVL